MLQVYERAYRLYFVTYKICQMLQSWDKLLSSGTSEIHRHCGITVRSSGEWFCAMSNRICSEFKQIELKWNRIVHQNALWSLRTGCKSALQPGTMTGRWSETFEDLLYLFSFEDKYKGLSLYYKGKIDWSIGINHSSGGFKWTQVFLCCQSFDLRGQWIF